MSRIPVPVRRLLLLAAVLAGLGSLHVPPSRSNPPASPSVLFLSPNTDEGLSLDESVRRLSTPAHEQSRRLARAILRRFGLTSADILDGVGDWSDGAENALLVRLPGPVAADSLRRAAASFGLAASQKAVLAFRHDPAGEDVLHVLDLPGTPAHIRALLDQHGIRGRTIIPGRDTCRVFVLDVGGRFNPHMRHLKAQSKGKLRQSRGSGEMLAGRTRDEARTHYHAVLKVAGPPR